MVLLQVDSNTIILDVVNCALKGSRQEAIVCILTVAVGFIIRAVEKRKIKKQIESKNKEIKN